MSSSWNHLFGGMMSQVGFNPAGIACPPNAQIVSAHHQNLEDQQQQQFLNDPTLEAKHKCLNRGDMAKSDSLAVRMKRLQSTVNDADVQP
uniref:MamL-1 domain-containing protein n=1 Tax=Globodera pallida TaxID=36090 RepID=A0A183BR06_GLOPA